MLPYASLGQKAGAAGVRVCKVDTEERILVCVEVTVVAGLVVAWCGVRGVGGIEVDDRGR